MTPDFYEGTARGGEIGAVMVFLALAAVALRDCIKRPTTRRNPLRRNKLKTMHCAIHAPTWRTKISLRLKRLRAKLFLRL